MLSRAQMCFALMISNPKMVNSIRGFLVMRLCKSCMMVSAVKLSSAKWKKTACSLAIASLFCISMSSGGLSAGAIDPSQVVTIEPSSLSAMIGPSITAYYLASDDTFKPITLNYYSDGATISSVDCEGWSNSDWYGCKLAYYYSSLSGISDFKQDSVQGGYVLIPVNLHFGNVSFMRFGLYSPLRGLVNTYNQTNKSSYDIGVTMGDNISDTFGICSRASNTSLGAVCVTSDRQTCAFSGWEFENNSASDCYLTDWICMPVVKTEYNLIFVGFTSVFVNSGYTFIGHDTPPQPPVTTSDTGSGSGGDFVGSGGGVISTDASGNTGFQYTVTMQVPEYIWSGSFAQNTDQFPVTVSALASGLDDYGTTAASALSALADEADIDGLWECADYFLPAGVVLLIMGCSSISLAGWILNRYSG